MDNMTTPTIDSPGCPWNAQVDCSDRKCSKCGWNPDVAVRRIEEYKARKLAEEANEPN